MPLHRFRTPSLRTLLPGLCLPLALLALGCGHKDGDPRQPVPATEPAPLSTALPEGVWSGRYDDRSLSAVPCQAVVLGDGTAHLLLDGDRLLSVTLRDGAGLGRLVPLSGDLLQRVAGDSPASVRLTSVLPSTSFAGTVEVLGQTGSFQFDHFDGSYQQRLEPAMLAGTYGDNGENSLGVPLRLRLKADGSVEGQAGEARLEGGFSIPDPARGAARISLNYRDGAAEPRALLALAVYRLEEGRVLLSVTAAGPTLAFAAKLPLLEASSPLK